MQAEMVLEGAPISDLPAARKAVSELQQKGCGTVVLTLGHKGVVFCESSDSPIEHVPAESVQAVDTTVGYKLASPLGQSSCMCAHYLWRSVYLLCMQAVQ